MYITPKILYSQQYGLGELSWTTGVDKWAPLSKQVDPNLSAPHHTASQTNIWVGTASGNYTYCLFLVATVSFEYTALHTVQLDCGLQKAQTLSATCSEMLMHSYKTFPANTGCVKAVAIYHVSVDHWPVTTRCANLQQSPLIFFFLLALQPIVGLYFAAL